MKTEFQIAQFRLNIFWFISGLFITAKLCLHLFTNTNYELLRDEMLYFNMGEHLSLGYATVPPLTAFLAFIAKTLFGYSVSGLRFLPAVLGAFSILIISKIVKEIGGGIPALIIASTSFLLCPWFLLCDTLFTPNVTENFLWLLITYFIFKMVKEERPRLWIPVGILLGISFLNKYSILIFIAGFFIALFVSEQRKLLLSRYLIYAVVLGILIILPNIIWQYLHKWPVTLHMSELKRTQLDNLNYVDFPVDLISLTLATAIVWITGLISMLFFRAERSYRYLGVASVMIIFIFFILKGKSYYVVGVLPILFAFGGYTMEKYLTGGFATIRHSALLIIVFISLLALPTGLPVISFARYNIYREHTKMLMIYPFFRWEDGKVHGISQVYSDMTGWKELTSYVAKAYNMLSEEERKTCTIYGERNYGYAGAVNFYGKQYGLPEAITFHESYTFWAPDSIDAGPLIYINNQSENLNELFGDIKEIGCVNDIFFREKGLKVFICRSPKTDIKAMYRKLAREEKSIFGY